jgi:hypothetical protein
MAGRSAVPTDHRTGSTASAPVPTWRSATPTSCWWPAAPGNLDLPYDKYWWAERQRVIQIGSIRNMA